MQGNDILEVLQRDWATGPTLRCVCSVDEDWMEPVALPASYVINTGTKNGPGEHWVAFYISQRGHCDYFESSGSPPPSPILRWIEKRSTSVSYNTLWLQGPTSDVCGQYCVYFLRERARCRPMRDILADFKELDFKYNDAKVARAVSRMPR